MSEMYDKVLCTDGGCNAATMAALMNNNRGAEMMAMANQNGFNSPWMYLVFLALFGGGGFGWNRGGGNAELENANSRAIASLSNQMSDNHNSDLILNAINGNRDAMGQLAQTFNVDFGQMQTAICGVKSAIEQVGGAVGYSAEGVKNAIALGDANIMQQMQSCCCNIKTAIIDGNYQNQLANERQTNTLGTSINDVRQAVINGFANIGYQNEKNTAAIIQNNTAQTQRILDQMCANTTQELRDAIAEKDRQLQTASIIAGVKTT